MGRWDGGTVGRWDGGTVGRYDAGCSMRRLGLQTRRRTWGLPTRRAQRVACRKGQLSHGVMANWSDGEHPRRPAGLLTLPATAYRQGAAAPAPKSGGRMQEDGGAERRGLPADGLPPSWSGSFRYQIRSTQPPTHSAHSRIYHLALTPPSPGTTGSGG